MDAIDKLLKDDTEEEVKKIENLGQQKTRENKKIFQNIIKDHP